MDKKDINTVQDLSDWVWEHIQGCFPPTDMKVHKREVEKLKPGDVYLEVGVSQGLSFTNAEHFSKDGVFVMGIDIYDPVHRAEYMQGKSELIRTQCEIRRGHRQNRIRGKPRNRGTPRRIRKGTGKHRS